MIRTVFFDLMDTLVRGPEKPRAKVYRTLGFRTLDEFDECGEAVTLESPGLSTERFFEALYAWRGIQPDKSAISEASRIWYNSFADVSFIDGAIECLNSLKEDGHTLAIVSNAYPPTHKLIDDLKLYSFVDRVFLSCDIGAWKPSARAFEVPLRAMGASAHSTCMIGNRISTDIVGAIGANISPILFKPSRPTGYTIVQGQEVSSAEMLNHIPSLIASQDFLRGSSLDRRSKR